MESSKDTGLNDSPSQMEVWQPSQMRHCKTQFDHCCGWPVPWTLPSGGSCRGPPRTHIA